MNNWIDTKSHLPEIDEYVIYVINSGKVCCGYMQSDGTWHEADSDDPPWSADSVVGWLPLPEPPEVSA